MAIENNGGGNQPPEMPQGKIMNLSMDNGTFSGADEPEFNINDLLNGGDGSSPEPKQTETEPKKDPISSEEISKEMEKAKKEADQGGDKGEYYKKILHLASLEDKLRSESKGLKQELEEYKQKLQSYESKPDPEQMIRDLATKNPMEIIKKYGVDKEKLLDQLISGEAGTDYEDDDPEETNFNPEKIQELIEQKVEEKLKAIEESKKQSELENRVQKFEQDLGAEISSGEFPLVSKIATQDHVVTVYQELQKVTGKHPTAKEVASTLEKWLQAEIGIPEKKQEETKQINNTLTGDYSSPVERTSRPTSHVNYDYDDDQEFFNSIVSKAVKQSID